MIAPQIMKVVVHLYLPTTDVLVIGLDPDKSMTTYVSTPLGYTSLRAVTDENAERYITLLKKRITLEP